jgi:hypothetical protein
MSGRDELVGLKSWSLSLIALAAVCTACGVGGTDYQGGVLTDPSGAVAEVSRQLVPNDGREDPIGPDESRGQVGGRIVRIERQASDCGRKPDVVVKVDGDVLDARLVLPPTGKPCTNGESYVVTLMLNNEYSGYRVG